MVKETAPSEADIIFNRANVALARSQRLIQSWLPPRTADEQVDTKTEQELLKEDQELFKPVPELLGLGAIAPETEQDSLSRKRYGPSIELREKLLGKKAANAHRASAKPQPVQTPSSIHKTKPKQGEDDDDDDEEEGRASMVGSARRKGPPPAKSKKQANVSQGSKQLVQGDNASSEDEDPGPTKKRPATYMDQLLAEKAAKKKRKQKA